MTTDTASSRPKPLRRRALIVVATTLVVFALVVAEAKRRETRRQWLLSEVHALEGTAVGDKPLWDRLTEWYQTGSFPDRSTMVLLLNDKFDNAWIRDHDYLRGLDIEMLESHSITGSDLTELIDSHPVELLDLTLTPLNAETIAAIGNASRLKTLGLFRTNLTDDGLTRLPLEQLELLSVADTKVTSQGLAELSRCRRLETVWLDANQLTEETGRALASLGTLKRIGLVGNDITDMHLQYLQQVSTLKDVNLSENQTTPEGRAALAAALPGCDVETPSTAGVTFGAGGK